MRGFCGLLKIGYYKGKTNNNKQKTPTERDATKDGGCTGINSVGGS